MKLKFSILFLVITAFLSCEEKAEKKFVRTWHDTEYIVPGRTTLKINSDFTFTYYAAGCQWRYISKGNWKIFEEDTIELNSISSDTCYNMFPFADCVKFGQNKKLQTTIKDCTAESETGFIIFKNEKFHIKNDSLVYNKLKIESCPPIEIKFAKTEKIKKNGY